MPPVEAEWERAARGTDGRIYPWGDHWDSRAVTLNASGPEDVGSKREGISPAGCLDMAGNVWEWTDDWAESERKYKVIRGGGFVNPGILRCSNRVRFLREFRKGVLGFRCARTP